MEEEIALVERIFQENNLTHSLSDLQEIVLRKSILGLSYQEIADSTSYDHDYIKQTGAKLWKDISFALDKKVTKRNIGSILRQYAYEQAETSTVYTSKVTAKHSAQDWGDAIDVDSFLGRDLELNHCQNWIVRDHCRLITILGMGGIGKTAIASKIAREVAEDFDYLIWRSLRNAPPFVELISDLVLFISGQEEINIPLAVDASIACLMKYLANSRCLLILDNAESILRSGETGGKYREDYEGYGQLLRRLADEKHQSCLIITSREQPIGIDNKESKLVRSLQLSGLSISSAQEILRTKGIADSARLIEQYSGNPLALKIASTTVKSIFGGNVADFLREGSIAFGNIWELLEQQFNRLSKLEQSVMYWLAINRVGLTLSELKQDVVPVVPIRHLLESLESLKRRSLIQLSPTGFTQQPVVMEYVTEKLISTLLTEISTGEIDLLQTHPMVKVKDKEYLRETQVRIILQPLATKILTQFEDKFSIAKQFNSILNSLRTTKSIQTSYAIGNLINLLKYYELDLAGYDFSGFSVWQADLRGVNLQKVNFTDADLSQSIFTEKFGSILALDFSPDGSLLATGDDQRIKIWQVPEYKLVRTLSGHDAPPVWALAFSPDGSTLASGSSDRQVKLWNVDTGECLKVFEGHQGSIGSLAFSPDGQTLVSSSEDNTIKIWQLETAKEIAEFPSINSLLVNSFALSPDGKCLATNNKGEGIQIWQIDPKVCLQTIKIDNCQDVLVVFSPNSKLLVIGLPEGTIKLWDITRKTWQITLVGHSTPLTDIFFSAGSETLFSSSVDATIRLWQVATGKCISVLRGHQSRISAISLNAKNQTLASCSEDGSARIWELQTRKCIKILSGYSDHIWSIAFSVDGQTIASANETGVIRLWNVQTGNYQELEQLGQGRIQHVAFSPDGQTLASVTYNYQIKIWHLASNRCVQTIEGGSNFCWSIAFSVDSQSIVTTGGDGLVRCWHVATGKSINILVGHKSIVLEAVFLSETYDLASTSLDKTVKLWSLADGKCVKTLQCEGAVWSIDYHAESNIMVTGIENGNINLWNLNTGKCLAILKGHALTILSLAFNADGSIIASSSHDYTIRLWDVATGECLKIIDAHHNSILSVVFSPIPIAFHEGDNREILASGSHDETIKLWDVETGECLKTFKAPNIYEKMNVKGAIGLSSAQKAVLRALGSID